MRAGEQGSSTSSSMRRCLNTCRSGRPAASSADCKIGLTLNGPTDRAAEISAITAVATALLVAGTMGH
jgi:hypothetical protein